MSDQDKDTLEEGEPNEFMPGDEDFEEEFEGEEPEEEARAEEREGGRFGRGRGGRGREAEQPALGSVRGAHERIKVDDRASAVFAVICAIGLVGILIGAVLAPYVPAIGGQPQLTPLNLQTFFVPTASPGASLSPAPSPTTTP